MNTVKAPPPKCTDEHLEFLDALRESGVTNMYGAVPYLEREFNDITTQEAKHILLHWMETYPRTKEAQS